MGEEIKGARNLLYREKQMRLRKHYLCEHGYYQYQEAISEMREPKTAFSVATYESPQFPAQLWSPSYPVWNGYIFSPSKSIVCCSPIPGLSCYKGFFL